MVKNKKPFSYIAEKGLDEEWLPLVDEFRTFCATEEEEKLCQELTAIA